MLYVIYLFAILIVVYFQLKFYQDVEDLEVEYYKARNTREKALRDLKRLEITGKSKSSREDIEAKIKGAHHKSDKILKSVKKAKVKRVVTFILCLILFIAAIIGVSSVFYV